MSSARLTELRHLTRLAAPLAAAHAGNQLMSVVDVAIVGRMGAAELAAVGLANSLFMPLAMLAMGAMMGLDPMISQAMGAGDPVRARGLLWQGAWLSVGLGLAVMVPSAFAPPILGLFGVDPAVGELATVYLWVRLLGAIPFLLFVALRSYLQALGITRPMLIGVVAANVFNVPATWLLVFGGADLPGWAGPLVRVPAMGVAGAALASTLCVLLQVGVVWAAVRNLPVEGFERSQRRADRAEIRAALGLGLPIGLQMFAEVGVFALVGLLVGGLGSLEMASHQIALTLASFSFSVAVGAGAAGSVRVGRAIGARDAPGTRRAGLVALAGGGLGMGLWSLIFVVAPGPLANLLTDDASVIAAAIPLLMVAAVFQIFDGLQAVGAGVLRGAGDTRFAFLANLAGHYGLGLPVGIALAYGLDQGVIGLWWGLCTGLTAVAIILAVRFHRLSSKPIAPVAPGRASTGATEAAA